MVMSKKRVVSIFIISLCFAVKAAAQLASNTSLVGTVTDTSGAVIAGVTVTAVNDGTHDTYTGATNAEGQYAFPFIKIGTYSVTATAKGFQTLSKTGVLIETNQVIRTDFVLQVGQVSQEVTVSAAVPPLATDDASLSEIVNQRQIADLPLNGRDPLRLAITTPGVVAGLKGAHGVPPGEDFIGAGAREIQNQISLDGISIMNNLITTTNFRPSVEAVQEFQVQTGTYPAQYGGYMGVHMNLVSKSGTNQLHGSLFEFLRNDHLDARGFFEKPTNPKIPFHQNQFGAEVGGPVVIPKLYNGKNKTFFMADYEGLRQVQSTAQLDTVLTPLMRGGNFSEVSTSIQKPGNPPYGGNIIPQTDLSPQATQLLQFMPVPNLPGITKNYLARVQTNDSWNQTVWRVDENVGKNSRLFFRYAWEKDTPLNGTTNPTGGAKSPNDDHNFVIGYTQTIRPTMVNDFRLGRQSLTTDSVNFFFDDPALQSRTQQLGIPGFTPPSDNPGVPDISITNYMGIGNGATNWFQTDQTWQGNDVFNYIRGAHSVTAGADISKMKTGRSAVNQPRGLFNFRGTISGNAAADFMLGLPLQVTTPAPEIPGVVAEWRDGFFVLDKWQPTRKLTLNLGLRFELATVPYTVNGNATNLNPGQTALIPSNPPVPGFKLINPNHRDFAPRFGFAYRATDKWVVRGGLGLYFNPNQMNSFTFLNTNPPFSPVFTFDSSPSTPTLSFSNPTPASSQRPNGPPNVIGVGPDLPPARMNQWSLDVERTLWHNAGLDVQYLGSHSYHLDRSFFNNSPPPGSSAPIKDRRPNQLWGVIRTISNDEIANYEGLNVVLRQRTSHGLTMLLSYTWSHTLDVSTDSNGGGAPMDPYHWRADYGNSNWDIRNRLVASYLYDLPFFKTSSQRLLRRTLGDWQINGLATIQSGLPFNVTVSGDPANTGVGNQRPDLIGPATADCGQHNLTNCISPSAFALPTPLTYGNLGRNILRGPHLINMDFSLFKNVPLGERARFQFRAEFFNLFNTPAFANPNAVFIPTTLSAFGSIGSTVNNNRQIQFAGKIVF